MNKPDKYGQQGGIRRELRKECPDCGARGETKGHMACQYPQNDPPPAGIGYD